MLFNATIKYNKNFIAVQLYNICAKSESYLMKIFEMITINYNKYLIAAEIFNGCDIQKCVLCCGTSDNYLVNK